MIQTYQLTLDDQNRLILPVTLQEQFRLQPGMQLILDIDHQGELYLQLPTNPQIINKEGVLVVRAELIGDIEQAIDLQRDLRMQSVSGVE